MDTASSQPAAGARVLELGCGFNKAPGAYGVDIIAGSSADLIHDLDVFPYPLAESSWDRIICRDVLEHVADFVRTMEEIWRVGRPGAMVEVSAPFMSSVNYFSDPTYSKARFEMLRCEYDAEERPKRRGPHRWALDWANRNKTEYENRYAFLYPLYNIFFDLRVAK